MREFDVIVVGGGHAGCEAAHAAARLGVRTALVTLDLDALVRMSCNPSIGGPAKGHLTREIDALGGLQAQITDATYINLRMLNTGKGASVQALRAQSDRDAYSREMRRRLTALPGLALIAGEVTALHARGGAMTGVGLADGTELAAARVIICPGTFTRGRCYIGSEEYASGRLGEPAADALGAALDGLGIRLHRLKTGTSPRIRRDSADYTALSPQLSEWRESAFANYSPAMLPAWFLPCWLTRTTAATRELISAHEAESALFGGLISGPGPRYCPSIEDKMRRFPGAGGHPVFVEPDGLTADVLYLQGLATSLPREVQQGFLATIPGLERAEVVKPGYAVEYDAVNPVALSLELESREIAGLYFAGQVNGTSGYEEAAAQGLAAGANAALRHLGREPLPLTRANSYTGVMLDDLATRGTEEPYRMLTARAEHRLLLRHDNAALRLGPIARDAGLLTDEQAAALAQLGETVAELESLLAERNISAEAQARLGYTTRQRQARRAVELLRQGAPSAAVLAELGWECPAPPFICAAAREHAAVEARYAGYLDKARVELERVRAQEHRPIPADFDFHAVTALLKATRENLAQVRPRTLGQAGRVPGVTPADVANLLVALKRRNT